MFTKWKIKMTKTDSLLIALAVFFLLGGLSSPFIQFSRLGAGSHTGYITAVEQEGYVFKNYSVYVKTDPSSSQEDVYCLHRDRVETATVAKEHAVNKKPVTIEYRGVRGVGLGLCNSYEIIGIK